MDQNKENLFTLRYLAAQINRLSEDPKVDALALEQIVLLSKMLELPVPEEFQTPEKERPNPGEPTKPATKPSGDVGAKLLWYPGAIIRKDLKMKVIGEYPKGYPRGAIIHWTSGRFDKGLSDSVNTIQGGIKNGYMYWCMDKDGKVIQTNPLNQWGYHAGASSWTIDGVKRSGVSNFLVGIEINNAGNLSKKNGKYVSWFDQEIPEKDVRISKSVDNVQAGAYHKYTEAQEKSLIEMLIWLKANNPDVFSFDYVLGHDEVAPSRKTDPGGSLSVTMPNFRLFLKAEYAKRYG